MTNFKLLLLTAAFGLCATGASALDRFSIYMLQSTLNDHGFSVGDPDGAIGPATRKGLREFAASYGTSADPDAVFDEMVRRSIAARMYISEEAFLEQTREEVARLLRDPESAMIRNVFRVRDADKDIICGEVNGRNAYGGYAGYVPFYGMLLMGRFAVIGVDGPQESAVALRCALAFTKR